ncbi:Uncharacterised protein [Acinetobacter baumannii]|nr:Uncharacterised protein [Acinetobacter baumannii]
MSAETVPVPGNEVLPAGSVAVAVTVSPSTRLPVTTAVSLPTLPAASVAVTVMVCGPSASVGSVLSASVQVPSPLFTAG